MFANLMNIRLSVFWISMTVLLYNTLSVSANLNTVFSQDNTPSAPLPSNGAPVDEVVVESSLYIKPKPKPSLRRTIRSVHGLDGIQSFMASSLVEHRRVKRFPGPQRRHHQRGQQQYQPRDQDYGQSQAAANAAANSQYHDNFGFGSSAGNAGSQAFNANGPSGSFGASSAGSLSQSLNGNRFGTENSAGASMSQVYHLPNGQTINFALTNSFANAPGGINSNSRGGAVSVSQP